VREKRCSIKLTIRMAKNIMEGASVLHCNHGGKREGGIFTSIHGMGVGGERGARTVRTGGRKKEKEGKGEKNLALPFPPQTTDRVPLGRDEKKQIFGFPTKGGREKKNRASLPLRLKRGSSEEGKCEVVCSLLGGGKKGRGNLCMKKRAGRTGEKKTGNLSCGSRNEEKGRERKRLVSIQLGRKRKSESIQKKRKGEHADPASLPAKSVREKKKRKELSYSPREIGDEEEIAFFTLFLERGKGGRGFLFPCGARRGEVYREASPMAVSFLSFFLGGRKRGEREKGKSCVNAFIFARTGELPNRLLKRKKKGRGESSFSSVLIRNREEKDTKGRRVLMNLPLSLNEREKKKKIA